MPSPGPARIGRREGHQRVGDHTLSADHRLRRRRAGTRARLRSKSRELHHVAGGCGVSWHTRERKVADVTPKTLRETIITQTSCESSLLTDEVLGLQATKLRVRRPRHGQPFG